MTAEAAAHVHAEVPSVSERLPSLPPELDPVFERALAKDPAARYPTGAEFVADLRQALHEAAGMTRQLEAVPPPAPPPPPAYGPEQRRRFPIVPVLLGLALLGLGILGAALLTRGGDAKPAAQTFIRTVVKTTPGKTVTQHLTVTSPTAPSTAAATPPAAGTDLAQGRRDSDAAFNLIRAGDYGGALPLAQKALAELKGTGDIYEAYANYNVGTSLIHLGRCSEGLPYLDASEAIQGSRKEIRNDRKLCKNSD